MSFRGAAAGLEPGIHNHGAGDWDSGLAAARQSGNDGDPGIRPRRSFRSVVADQDGNIWFTASFAGYIGKLDPGTGAISEYRLPADARDPHTPVFDPAGNLWFTVIGANAIGRLVPKTGEMKMPPLV